MKYILKKEIEIDFSELTFQISYNVFQNELFRKLHIKYVPKGAS